MKKTLLFAGLLSAVTIAVPVFADDDDCYVPMSQWQSRDAARSWANSQGWDVRRIKIDDGCYKIKGYDQSGREIEVKIDPATLAIIKFEYEDDDDDHKRDKKKRDKKHNKYKQLNAPAGSATPPDNGLFAPGGTPKVIVK